MSRTFTNLLTHLIFSTKDREPLIVTEVKFELFPYLGGLTRELKGKAYGFMARPITFICLLACRRLFPFPKRCASSSRILRDGCMTNGRKDRLPGNLVTAPLA
jgi:hypothetical protein